MKFTAAAIALAGAVSSVEGAVLGEGATYAVKGAAEGEQRYLE